MDLQGSQHISLINDYNFKNNIEKKIPRKKRIFRERRRKLKTVGKDGIKEGKHVCGVGREGLRGEGGVEWGGLRVKVEKGGLSGEGKG